MTRKPIYFILILLSLIVAGCSRSEELAVAQATAVSPPAAEEKTAATSPRPQAARLSWWVEEQPRQDVQGAVEVTITPLNLNNPGETLDFEVSMNTHSVDLSMDLAVLSTLTTDTGLSVTPVGWDAPAGGHHVGGTLSFPASAEGQPVLEQVKTLTLTIVDLDAPQRVFVWERE